jgi:hypothetical protein
MGEGKIGLTTSRGRVHQVILDQLASGNWVSGKELLKITGQSYYDRRVRELRDEEGWNIVTEFNDGQPGYRLVSVERGLGKRRHYPSKKQKDKIYSRDNVTCQLCGVYMGGKNPTSNPQIDHKIPLIRGGDKSDNNLQILCQECNVIKRGVCSRCSLPSCIKCFYAFPSAAKDRIIINLSPSLREKLESLAKKEKKNIDDILIQKINEILKDT